MKFPLSAVRLLTAAALGCVVAVCIGAPQAQAQFVCVGNANGAAVPPGIADGAGATATGIATTAINPFPAPGSNWCGSAFIAKFSMDMTLGANLK